MKKIILSFTVLSILVTSCTKEITTIAPIDQVQSLGSRGLIYSLPRTNLRIKVQSTNTIYIPGPYAQYAQKYLGISDIKTESDNIWYISEIKLHTVVQPDMNSLFVVDPSPNFRVDFLQLEKVGLVIPISSLEFNSVEHSEIANPSENNRVQFVDMSPTPFIANEQTTHYSRVFQDSTFVRVPVHKSIVIEKSKEDKAREAADFIYTLRKRRLELLSGDADFVAEGKAAEAVLKEISRLENEYLALFIGISYNRTYANWYDYTPNKESNSASILFRFSSSKGILPISDLSGRPVLITLANENNWQEIDLLNNLSIEKGMQRTDAVYYRIPVPISIKISDSQTELLSRTLTFYQFGPLVRFPSRFMLNNNNITFPELK